MNEAKQIERRDFIKLSTRLIVSIPLLTINSAVSQELTELTEDDPNAQTLGYKIDARSVNVENYPNYESNQSCANCLFYQGEESDDIGPCIMFLGKTVISSGWCSVYTAIPT